VLEKVERPFRGGESRGWFDLSQQSSRGVRRVKTLRQVFTVLSILVVGLLLWFVEIALAQGVKGFQWVAFPIVILCLSFLLSLFVVLFWKTRPGAIGLTVRDDGLAWAWTSNRSDFLPWQGLRKGFEINDYSEVTIIRAHTSDLWELHRWNRPVTFLSREAYDAIVRGASSHGLRVLKRRSGTGPLRWIDCELVRFG